MISVPLQERVIYLRYDIALRAMIYASRMKERILYHACVASISYGLPYIISHSDISLYPTLCIDLLPFLCYNKFTKGVGVVNELVKVIKII